MITENVVISLNRIDNVARHVHHGLECMLVVNGTLDMELNGDSYHLAPDGFLLINGGDIHACLSRGANLVLTLEVPDEFIRRHCPEALGLRFSCNSIRNDYHEQLFGLKRLLTRMFLVYVKDEPVGRLEFQALLLRFFATLIEYYHTDNPAAAGQESASGADPLAGVLAYVGGSYASSITLADAAQKMYMSPQYFSKYFKRKMGVGFAAYLAQVRLEHAVSSLLYSSDTIYRIAMNSGFANAKSFTEAFRKKYAKSPGEYRKRNKAAPGEGPAGGSVDLTPAVSDDVDKLVQYMHFHDMHYSPVYARAESVAIDMARPPGDPLFAFCKLLYVGGLDAVLQAETQARVRLLQQKVGFDCAYIDSFDLPMYEAEFDDNYDGSYILYELVSHYQALGLSLFLHIDLAFVRSRLNGDLAEYYRRLAQFMQVLGTHFGAEYPATVKLELACGSREELPLFSAFCGRVATIAREKPGCQVGLFLPDWALEEGNAIFQSAAAIRPDFFGFHGFPGAAVRADEQAMQRAQVDYFDHLLAKVQAFSAGAGLPGAPLYMSKWNTLTGRKYPEYGTFFRSALILDVMVKLGARLAGLGFNLRSFGPQQNIQDLGLFAIQSIKRPAYFVLEAAKRLNGRTIAVADNAVATLRADGGYAVALYAPCYVDPFYSLDQYFIEHEIRQITLSLHGLAPGQYRVKRFVFDKTSTGVFYRWSEIEGADYKDPDVVERLEKILQPDLYLYHQAVEDTLTLNVSVSFNGIVLYLIDWLGP